MTPRSSLPELAKIKTAGWYRCFSEAAVLLKEEYSELRAVDQRRVESALTDLREGQLINSMPLMFAQQSRTRSTTLKEFVNPDGTPKHLQTLSHLTNSKAAELAANQGVGSNPGHATTETDIL